MSVKALTWAFEQQVGDAIAKLILIALADHSDERGGCFPSRKKIADYAECSVDTVDRKLALLATKGFIEKSPMLSAAGDPTANFYTLLGVAATCGEVAAQPCGEGSRRSAATKSNHQTKPSKNTDEFDFDLGFPSPLNTPEFSASWQAWERYRKERGQKLTPSTIELQIAKLCKMGLLRAIAAIKHSIESGYTGIFEPKQSYGTTKHPKHFTASPANAGTCNQGVERQY